MAVALQHDGHRIHPLGQDGTFLWTKTNLSTLLPEGVLTRPSTLRRGPRPQACSWGRAVLPDSLWAGAPAPGPSLLGQSCGLALCRLVNRVTL